MLLVTNIKWEEGIDPIPQIAERLGVAVDAVCSAQLLKRSVDGRRRPPVWLANYQVEVLNEAEALSGNPHGVRPWTKRDEARFRDPMDRALLPKGHELRPIVVGAGPAGLFAALRLAEAGAHVTLLERGSDVDGRHQAVRRFWRHRELNPECNVVYGEGGAGAFSDGKIYTRRRDGDLGYIFRRLVDFGADPAILEEGWAHLGTDKVREIIPRLRQRLIELGAQVRFDANVTGLVVDAGQVRGVYIGDEVLEGAPVVVAAGHSARDTYQWMLEAGAKAELRPIHLGVRIEHPQKLIDRGRYGGERGDLPPASYRFASKPPDGGRPAHTFCMCPGGTVVPATNHPERVVVNGMSYSGRRAFFANSAIIVQATTEDFDGDDPMAGVRFQDRIERLAFDGGGGDYTAPAQRVEDLLSGQLGSLPKTSFPMGVRPFAMDDLFPAALVQGLKEAVQHFDSKLDGFAGPEAVLVAPETRTTAPLRFLRTKNHESVSLPGLMPVGEGAGHAGGIVSAALDGLLAAESAISARTG